MNSILVTGGAGYVGSKFAHDAVKKGYKVIIVDNLDTGNLNLVPKKAKFYKCNILNEKKINLILKRHKIKDVVHFAASTNVLESMQNPQKYYLNNTIATEKLIGACCRNNINKFIFSSTCAVYGDPIKDLVSENDQCLPKSHYAKSKYLSEILLQNYSNKFDFDLIIFRYFNVIGADKELKTGCTNNMGQLFKNLSENILKKKYKIDIYGNDYKTPDKTCIRDFIDINDLSYYHLSALKKKNRNKFLLLNCGYKKGYSIAEVVSLFEKVIKKKIKKKFIKKREGDIEKIVCENKLINKIFPLKNPTNIIESIKTSIDWEKKLK